MVVDAVAITGHYAALGRFHGDVTGARLAARMPGGGPIRRFAAQRRGGREIERILPIDDYRHSADPSQVHPGADHTCQDIKTTGCSLTTKCVLLICAASRQPPPAA